MPASTLTPEQRVVNRACTLGSDIHGRDTDKVGKPYFEHLMAVAAGVRVLGGDYVTEAAAWLHDAIEDHPDWVDADFLTGEGIPADVIDVVLAVTKRPGQSDEEYMEQVIAGGRRSQILKLADLLHNTRPDRVAALEAIRPGARVWSEDRYRWKIETLLAHLGIVRLADLTQFGTPPPQDLPEGARPFTDLQPAGLLWLINTAVFHPRGYALALVYGEAGALLGWRIITAPAGEPVMFRHDDPDIDGLFMAAEQTLAAVRGQSVVPQRYADQDLAAKAADALDRAAAAEHDLEQTRATLARARENHGRLARVHADTEITLRDTRQELGRTAAALASCEAAYAAGQERWKDEEQGWRNRHAEACDELDAARAALAMTTLHSATITGATLHLIPGGPAILPSACGRGPCILAPHGDDIPCTLGN